jgi:opacity protein-like surface antigen
MRLRLFPPTSLAVLLVFSAFPIFAQVSPAGVVKTLPLNVGVGFSNYDTGFGSEKLAQGSDRLNGGTLWLDYDPNWMPRRLYGLGIMAQGRDLNLGQPSNQPFLREDVGSGGAIYRWNRYFLVRPYGEFLEGFGNADYKTQYGFRYHQTRTVTTAGGGAEFDAYHRLWVRADYEYEWWPNFFISGLSLEGKDPAAKLDPQGITVGFSYHFNQGESR